MQPPQKGTLTFASLLLCLFGNLGDCRAQNIEPLVPGMNEMVVVHPGAHERGLPAVNLEPTGDDQHWQIDSPPTLHVHRFYYSGNKEFQGPIVQGGPTIVVANHPRTGERMYVDVNLPSGAPTIVHSEHEIVYVFSDRRVAVHFNSLFTDRVTVRYHGGRGHRRKMLEHKEATLAKCHERMSKSAAVQSAKDSAKAGGEFLAGLCQAADKCGSCLLDGAKTVAGVIPGVTSLASMGQEAAQPEYENQVRGAARQKDSAETKFIRTNR